MGRNVKELHPRLQEKIVQLQTLCNKEGLKLGIAECFRSVAEQNALYAQGRTKSGSIVTNAPGSSYSSQHQWGIAFDFYKNVSGHAYDDDAFFRRVGQLGKSIGLGWGGDWHSIVDKPHLYLPDWGSGTSILKSTYGTFANFKKTWGTASVTPIVPAPSSTTGPVSNSNTIVRDGQIHCNNYVNAKIAADGIFGSATKKAGIKCFQQACRMDYGASIAVDGIRGSATNKALSGHTVRVGESQEMVRALQINLMLRGYNPNGVDGSFGSGCHVAVIQYQKDHGLTADGIAGRNTFNSLMG